MRVVGALWRAGCAHPVRTILPLAAIALMVAWDQLAGERFDRELAERLARAAHPSSGVEAVE